MKLLFEAFLCGIYLAEPVQNNLCSLNIRNIKVCSILSLNNRFICARSDHRDQWVERWQ